MPDDEGKAYLLTETNVSIPCLFNPAELTIAKAVSWKAPEAKGKNAPNLRFQAGQPGTLSLSLTLDTTSDGSPVTEHTDKLLALMKVDANLTDADTGNNSSRPPWVEFHWGSTVSFRAVLERAQIRFTYFSSTGQPLRAKAELALKQFADDEQHPLQNPTSHTPTLRRLHHLRSGETLDRVAAEHYGDHSRWRQIAEANDIDDPFRLPAGAALVIPALSGRRRG